jgi:hypothetical protein
MRPAAQVVSSADTPERARMTCLLLFGTVGSFPLLFRTVRDPTNQRNQSCEHLLGKKESAVSPLTRPKLGEMEPSVARVRVHYRIQASKYLR